MAEESSEEKGKAEHGEAKQDVRDQLTYSMKRAGGVKSIDD